MREGSGQWREGVSPYELSNQTLSSDIAVRAVDKAGNITIANLKAKNALPKPSPFAPLILGLLVLIFVSVLRKKKKKR